MGLGSFCRRGAEIARLVRRGPPNAQNATPRAAFNPLPRIPHSSCPPLHRIDIQHGHGEPSLVPPHCSLCGKTTQKVDPNCPSQSAQPNMMQPPPHPISYIFNSIDVHQLTKAKILPQGWKEVGLRLNHISNAQWQVMSHGAFKLGSDVHGPSGSGGWTAHIRAAIQGITRTLRSNVRSTPLSAR